MAALKEVNRKSPAQQQQQSKRNYTVAEYIAMQIDASHKKQHEIAREIGYDKPNVMTMIKKGHTKLPLNKVGPLAKALGLDPKHLLRMVMTEYQPDTWAAIEEVIGNTMISDNELEILTIIRQNNSGDPELTTDKQRDALRSWAKGLG